MCQSTQIIFPDSCGLFFVNGSVKTFTSIHSSILYEIWSIISQKVLKRYDALCTLVWVQFLLNMWDFLSLSGLFDAVQPLNDSSISLHGRDPIWNAFPTIFFLILISIWQTLIWGAPWPVTIRWDHRGRAEIQTDDIRTGSCKVLWTNSFQFLRVKATVVKKAFYISSSPSVPVWQVWFRSV